MYSTHVCTLSSVVEAGCGGGSRAVHSASQIASGAVRKTINDIES